MKKFVYLLVVMVAAMGILSGCSGSGSSNTPTQASSASAESTGSSDPAQPITVISREDGSGTRGAFIELFEIEEEDADGNAVDMTTDEASITNSTSVMMTTVAGNETAIGYISLGSMNDTVKALPIDGVDASVENIENDTYKVSRPFNIATKDGISEVAQDFIDYIMSAEGQAVVEENGYIPVADGEQYAASGKTGKIVVAGSSSVTPVMEKLKEAYIKLNPDVDIEIQQSDSTTGIQSAIDGICDIGMASRDLKDSETSAGLKPSVIAIDGIAVIVNHANAVDALTSEQVKAIFTGETTTWSEIAK